jgi:phage pi2 protein 07
MLHSRWIYTLGRMEQFIDKHLNGGKNGLTTSSAVR